MEIDLQLLGDRVLVEPDILKKQSKGGLILPENAIPQPNIGSVVAVGDGWRGTDGTMTPLPVKVGDKVLFSQHGGSPLEYGDKLYGLLAIYDIVAIIKPKED